MTEAQVQYLLASLDRIAAALEARVAQPPAPAPSAAELVRSTYPPSAPTRYAMKLLNEAENGMTDMWHNRVRDLLRELAAS